MRQVHKNKKIDNKPTAGNLPDHQKEFENTTWECEENSDSKTTEAERKNVSKTLPDTAVREKSK